MLTIETKETKISDELKRKIEMIGRFTNTTPLITNGSVLNIKGTNLQYVEPHRIIIKGITFLAFNYENILYIENLSNAIPLNDLEQYIKSIN